MNLKTIIESFQTEERKQISNADKKKILEMISNYNSLGDSLTRKGSLPEIARQLAEIAEAAESLAISETSNSEFFNSKVVSENMKNLKKHSATFNKLAQEAHGVEQQLTALYEDVGHILGRYFEIKEPLDEITSIDDL